MIMLIFNIVYISQFIYIHKLGLSFLKSSLEEQF